MELKVEEILSSYFTPGQIQHMLQNKTTFIGHQKTSQLQVLIKVLFLKPIDTCAGQILGPHKLAQLVMVRSLLGKWKQPIYYDFDRCMSEQILKNIITEVHGSDFQVIAVVSDMGGGNRAGFETENGETIDKTCVQHLLEKSAHELKLHHLDVEGSARQKVKTAAQLFSNRV
ncbi:hypothetical protein PR048_021718 [Dryococelus australis]|uniref:Transposable element P transposase-like RNase H domain-containing protein n=1 Tax=Dryococelus australis TaxID=614101 RepID=A0ABQ9GYY7_9NEOP|nr:hypothetical protein PR048_021718 [Dryococelus australis]